MLIANRKGHYHFLRGIEPYSAGVISDPGFEIVHVTLQEWVQWRQGFEVIDAHLNQVNVERNALCGIELLRLQCKGLLVLTETTAKY